MVSAYRDVVACGEEPVANEIEAYYSGAEGKPAGLSEKVDSREQFILDAVGGILQVGLRLSRAAQHTLRKFIISQGRRIQNKTCITQSWEQKCHYTW